jgi:hypothetical protein
LAIKIQSLKDLLRFQTEIGADGFGKKNQTLLEDLQLKIVVGDRDKKQKIDCFILSENLSVKKVETVDVDNDVLDHNPIGLQVAFDDIKLVDKMRVKANKVGESKVGETKVSEAKVETKVSEAKVETKVEEKIRRQTKKVNVPARKAQAI